MISSGSSPKLIATGNGLPRVEIFLPHDPPLFAGRDIEREGVAIMDHDPIAAQVDPAFIDVPADHDVSRTEITAAVILVPLRRRQREKIDIVPFHDVFENRSAGNGLRGIRPRIMQSLFPCGDELPVIVLQGQVRGEALFLERLMMDTDEQAMPLPDNP